MTRKRREKDGPNTTTSEVTTSPPKLSQVDQDRIRREGERIAEEQRANEAAATPAPQPTKTDKPERSLPSVTAEVFARASGRRPEHMAGFLARARSEKLGRRTIPEWEEAWQKFMNTPIKC